MPVVMDPLCHHYGRRLTGCLLTVALSYLLTIQTTAKTAAQSLNSSNRPHLAQLIFRDHSSLTVAPSDATTLPPTELRLLYAPNGADHQTPLFPNRIRFSQSKTPEAITVAETRSDPESFREIDQYASSRGGGASVNMVMPQTAFVGARDSTADYVTRPLVFLQSVINQSTVFTNDTLTRTVNGTVLGTRALLNTRVAADSSDGKVVQLDAGGSGTSSSSNVGHITVGALIGIIAGILTALVLASFAGLICYRRRHPTWNSAETDLRVLAAHYGSYWDDKTLPNYQFNDRMIWPGETHEEMIALDNDAFLKSLEDLGRVNSRPSSKTNWNAEEDQRQSTKV